MSETITLGGRNFALRPLTLGELRPLLDALDAMTGKSGGALIDGAARLVHAALARGYPDLALDDILGLEASLDELNGAVAAVLRLAGLVRVDGGPVGEAAAASVPAPGSPPSMAPSLPAAAIPSA